MIKSLKDLHEYLEEDLKRNGVPKNPIKYFLLLLSGNEPAHVYRYLRNLRKTEYYKNCNIHIFYPLYIWCMIRHKRLSLKYQIQLAPNIAGKGMRIMHLTGGLMLNAKSIGEYCGFNGGTFIGKKDSDDNRPIIGNRVAFGPGAKAFGRLIINDNSFIAANCVVTKDVERNSIVAGIPGRIIGSKS